MVVDNTPGQIRAQEFVRPSSASSSHAESEPLHRRTVRFRSRKSRLYIVAILLFLFGSQFSVNAFDTFM